MMDTRDLVLISQPMQVSEIDFAALEEAADVCESVHHTDTSDLMNAEHTTDRFAFAASLHHMDDEPFKLDIELAMA